MADQYRTSTYFIASFLARGALIGARRCSSAKRRVAFTSLADSDPGHREARAGRVRQHDELLRIIIQDCKVPDAGIMMIDSKYGYLEAIIWLSIKKKIANNSK
jgi:hypothetical protein